jgi:hypothetical protein
MLESEYLTLAHSVLQALDDGVLDEAELDHLLAVAMRDGVIDDKERMLLQKVFDRLPASSLSDDTRAALAKARERFGL